MTTIVSGDRSAPDAVRVWLLGGFRVSVGSRTISGERWRLRKAASLMKLIALAPGYRLHREQAMDLLWPGSGTRAASNNLRQTLHATRRILDRANGPGYLVSENESIVLCPKSKLWVDVEAFEQASDIARRSKDPSAYRAAIELYSGELLPEDRYEEWTQGRRGELRQTFLSLLVEIARLHEEHGTEELEPAVQALKRVLAEEPTNEEAHVGLMRLYASSGSQVEALRQYGRLSEALSSQLSVEPSSSTRALREEIVAGRFRAGPTQPAASPTKETAGGARAHNLPARRTSFVGREREMLEIKRTLAMTRLLTFTGTGGSGKTRLALEVARDLVGAYPDGVWLADLAPLSEENLVPQVVAQVMKVPERPGRSLTETLVGALRDKDMLLMMDNCEHLIEMAARLADVLLSSCPHVRVVATSREVLGVEGELVWRVGPLPVPEADPDHRLPATGELARYDAVRLFVERSRLRSPHFELRSENARAVAQICRMLEGIPLALELAAARVGVLSVKQISERLDDALMLLRGLSRTNERRHQTLRGTLEWSYGLLSDAERTLFERLSVFAGGWTLEAAEAVGTGEGIGKEDVLDLLERLTDKSLVIVIETGDEGALRYRLLEPVRQYAHGKLEQGGDAEAARRRHALWYLALAEEAEEGLVGTHYLVWLKRLKTEHDNLRVALRWFLERGETELGLRLAAALAKDFWRTHERLREGFEWLEAALAGEGDASPWRAKALAHAGWIAWERLDFERSTALSEEALALSRELGYKEGAAAALYNLGMVAIYDQMRAKDAWSLFEECLVLRRQLEDEVGMARTLQKIGLILVIRRDFERAEALYEEGIELVQKTGDPVGRVVTLWLGGLASLGLGNHESVRNRCRECLDVARQIEDTHTFALIMHVLGASACEEGQSVRSARLWGAAESVLDTLGLGMGPAERHFYEPYFTVVRTQLGEEAFEMAWAEGRAMTLPEALEYASSSEEETVTQTVSAPEVQPSADQPSGKLTRREEEVTSLVARGLTNRRISEELFISERTVDAHVRKILKKLGLRSRAQIAARARVATEASTAPGMMASDE